MINFEVNKAVRMKSTVYFVAYKDYKKEELRNIVQTPSQVYKAERFQSLNRMLNSLVGNSCTKVTSETTYFVCLKEDYSVRYRIPSSYQSRKDEILCRYKLKDNSVYEKKPYRISQNNIFCPRHKFQKDGEVLQSDYSLDNGKTYEGNLKITAIFCVSAQDDLLQNVDNQPETTVLTVVTAEITVTTAETPPTTMDPLTTTQSTTEPVTTMRTTSVVKQESTANTDILPHHLGPTGIRPKTTPKAIVTTVPMVVTEERTLDNSVVYALMILTLGVIVLVLCCFYCCLRPHKELPAVQIIQRDSNMCTHTCTRLTLPSCRFQNNMRRIEGKLDTLCDFVQCYNQMPLLWYQPRSKVCTEACSHGSTGASSRDCSPSGVLPGEDAGPSLPLCAFPGARGARHAVGWPVCPGRLQCESSAVPGLGREGVVLLCPRARRSCPEASGLFSSQTKGFTFAAVRTAHRPSEVPPAAPVLGAQSLASGLWLGLDPSARSCQKALGKARVLWLSGFALASEAPRPGGSRQVPNQNRESPASEPWGCLGEAGHAPAPELGLEAAAAPGGQHPGRGRVSTSPTMSVLKGREAEPSWPRAPTLSASISEAFSVTFCLSSSRQCPCFNFILVNPHCRP
ncbi:uncharacterized protein LOC102154920 isoform X1 [Canis lupus familiaris]|uniref:uncharacterized protein LOC102154920 isoform X1 n=4 Tax=Canis lupus familiaris TaxID=9615 RepID=UPI0018F52D13|nr:uncharacterized protein LOC102154920 isoform X1 [Canis lupus familiaris]XP_038349154.1 uncharacterized protein LOC102154920 isoform X1 [Canis lupus familiaris]XP_038349158.1 uncharacterized protein LOC102154920 isoform X1 [Canis lupus familiaris]XP_038349168.1 uncharacterized protein LOC102154920 isoform X1 [Canis lupus familiaris]XP_038349170.1 uncharacterized protein LOC102154920 isoform X1 [Canis lupus familiaris]